MDTRAERERLSDRINNVLDVIDARGGRLRTSQDRLRCVLRRGIFYFVVVGEAGRWDASHLDFIEAALERLTPGKDPPPWRFRLAFWSAVDSLCATGLAEIVPDGAIQLPRPVAGRLALLLEAAPGG